MQLQEERKLSVRQRLVPKMTYQAQNTNNTDDEYENIQMALKLHLRKDMAITCEMSNIKSI